MATNAVDARADVASADPKTTPVDFDPTQVQELVLRGHGSHGSAQFELFRIADDVAARAWVGRIAGRVSHLESQKSDTRLQVAFTARGLEALGLKRHLPTFPIEFQLGMAARAHALGDDREDVVNWDYGSPENPVHVALLLYATSDTALLALAQEELADAARSGLTHVATQETLRYEDKRQIFEPFGFRDGLVQPTVDMQRYRAAQPEDGTPGKEASHKVPLGEVVLGQLNGYKFRTIGPSVLRTDDRADLLPPFLSPDRKDLGAHGTYLVFRKLEQDVFGFWQAVEKAAKALGKDEEWLAARMVGRWKNGSSLIDYPEKPGPAPTESTPGMSFAADRHGFRCPLGAHVRRANPRDDLGDDTENSLKLVARHRIHRRGRVYGPPVTNDRVDDKKKRGLMFITVGSSIRRQFEFVQNLWVTNTTFRGLTGEDDPVVGPRAPAFFGDGSGAAGTQTSAFSIQGSPVRTVVPALPRFVTTRGGDYFFLPSIAALRFISSAR